MWMANDGNYVSDLLPRPKPYLSKSATDAQRELRYFTPWYKHRQVEEHSLPGMIRKITGQVCFRTANHSLKPYTLNTY